MSSVFTQKLRENFIAALADDPVQLQALHYARLLPGVLDRPMQTPYGADIPVLFLRYDTLGGLPEGHFLAPDGLDVTCALDIMTVLAQDYIKCYIQVYVHDVSRMPNQAFEGRKKTQWLVAVHKSALFSEVKVINAAWKVFHVI